jgi:hypothetical protein
MHINTVWKSNFVKKWYVIGHCKCHFVFQYTNIHQEELHLKKSFYSQASVITVEKSNAIIGNTYEHRNVYSNNTTMRWPG